MVMGPVERSTRAQLRRANKSLEDGEEEGFGDVQTLLVVACGIDTARREKDFTGLASLVREYRQLLAAILAETGNQPEDPLSRIEKKRRSRKGG